jgi:hypothetical protein
MLRIPNWNPVQSTVSKNVNRFSKQNQNFEKSQELSADQKI